MTAIRCLIAMLALAAALAAHAESEPIPIGADPRIVVFPHFDENEVYTIVVAPLRHVHIQFEKEEKVQSLKLSDNVNWIKDTGGANNLFLKPIKAGLQASATVLTSKRAYQLRLISSPDGGKSYQKVSWHYPEIFEQQLAAEAKASEVVRVEAERVESHMVSPTVAIEELNFRYELRGDADFKPLQVFDDGKFVWLRMRETSQTPAVFLIEEEGPRLVNFHMRGQFLVIQRLFKRAMLKIGKQEIEIRREG